MTVLDYDTCYETMRKVHGKQITRKFPHTDQGLREAHALDRELTAQAKTKPVKVTVPDKPLKTVAKHEGRVTNSSFLRETGIPGMPKPRRSTAKNSPYVTPICSVYLAMAYDVAAINSPTREVDYRPTLQLKMTLRGEVHNRARAINKKRSLSQAWLEITVELAAICGFARRPVEWIDAEPAPEDFRKVVRRMRRLGHKVTDDMLDILFADRAGKTISESDNVIRSGRFKRPKQIASERFG